MTTASSIQSLKSSSTKLTTWKITHTTHTHTNTKYRIKENTTAKSILVQTKKSNHKIVQTVEKMPSNVILLLTRCRYRNIEYVWWCVGVIWKTCTHQVICVYMAISVWLSLSLPLSSCIDFIIPNRMINLNFVTHFFVFFCLFKFLNTYH